VSTNTEPEKKQAAPGELDLIRQFLNTHDVEEGTDDIGAPEALRAWLAERDLETGSNLGSDDVDRAAAMRESLRALALANTGEPLDPEAVPTLNSIASGAQLVVRFDEHGHTGLEPSGEGADAALGELLAIVFRAMADGTWVRLKACREDTCQWAFYDRSKNRSGTWCSMAVCGNRAKARAYRERHRNDA